MNKSLRVARFYDLRKRIVLSLQIVELGAMRRRNRYHTLLPVLH